MPREAACIPVQAPRTRDTTRHGPDLLRRERFGALYYSRRDCSTFTLPDGIAQLFFGALEESLLDVWARNPELLPLADEELAVKVARWQQQGFLDGAFRCNARPVEGDLSHGGLSSPLAVHLGLTRACNLRCTHCYVPTMAKPAPDELTTEELLRLFAELEEIGSPVLVVAGGEPLLRKDIFALLDGIEKHHLVTFLCTNATPITEKVAERLAASSVRALSISLDGPTAELHDTLRGSGQFERTLRAIRWMVAAGGPGLQLRVTVAAHNIAHLEAFAPLAQCLGVDRVVFKAFDPIGEASGAADLVITRTAYLEAIDRLAQAWSADDVQLETSNGIPTLLPEWTGIHSDFGCVGGTTQVSVNYDGTVSSCGSVPSKDDWSLRQNRLADAWRSAPSIASWRNLVANDTCRSCAKLVDCRGSCRSRALATRQDFLAPDPFAYCGEDRAPALVQLGNAELKRVAGRGGRG